MFYILSGNLSRHLFPTYPPPGTTQISEEVRAIGAKYGLSSNSAGLGRQFGSVIRKIFRGDTDGRALAKGRAMKEYGP